MNRANGIEWEHPCLLEKKRECNYEENEEDPVWHVKTSRSLKSYNMGEGRKKQSLSHGAMSTDAHGPHNMVWAKQNQKYSKFYGIIGSDQCSYTSKLPLKVKL